MGTVLSIVVACPHPLKLQGVATIVRDGGHTLSSTATDIDGLLQTVSRSVPDIAVVDGCLCGEDMSAVRRIVERGATVAVLAGREREAAFIQQALQAGARGCLCCDDSADRFLHSLELLALGAVVISREHVERLKAPPLSAGAAHAGHLTRREQQVAAMVARGATNQEIGETLYLSGHTVKIHVKNILDKLNLRNRQQLAAYVAREGLVEGVPTAE